MVVKKINRDIIIVLLIIGMLLLGLVTNDLVWKLILFTSITILILYCSRLEILNPIFWFTIILYLYGVPHTVLSIISNNRFYDYFPTDIDLASIATSTFFVAFFINKAFFGLMRNKEISLKSGISYKIIRIVLLILIILNIFFIIYLKLAGVRTKLDLINTGIIYKLYTNLNILYCFIINVYFGYRILSNRKYILRFILIFILNLMLYYYTGERDIIVFPVISTFLILGYKKVKYIKLKYFVPLLIFGIVSLPLMLNFGIRNSGGGKFLNFENFFYRIFSSELITASKNLDLIVSDANFVPLGIIIPFSVLVNSFVELPFFPTILNFHSIGWFNERYYYYLPKGAGAGFSLVAEGYMFAGILGVIIWFIIISSILYFLYRSSNKKISFLNIYTVIVPVFMYSVRGSLENIFTYLVRLMIWYVLLFIANQLLTRTNRTN